jgi:hydroxybutyrate-dimer hydrolase
MNNVLTGKRLTTFMLMASTFLIGGCGSEDSPKIYSLNISDVTTTEYDGVTDGLLAGLGLSGIKGLAPGYEDIESPTISELRKNAIYINYTALVSQKDGMFGVEYGPTNDATYAGTEYVAYVGNGINRAILMVQVPSTFNVDAPCIVAGPASGSRGIYGAIGTSGAWGLENNCAVAYTDMNKGTGAVDLTQSKGFGIQLNALDLNTNEELTFRVPTKENANEASSEYANISLPTAAQVQAYTEANPHRYAFKHAYSQKNPEKDWGLHTLQAIKFAFNILNGAFSNDFTIDNTMVIAASVSNGGAGVIRAAEMDTEGLIDAVVAGEPNVMPAAAEKAFSIKAGSHIAFSDHSKTTFEYFVIAELFGQCANKDPVNAGALFATQRGPVDARCNALVDAGLLNAGTLEELGAQSTQKLLEAGFTPESIRITTGYASLDLYQSLITTYANQFTRSSIVDNVCNVSMGVVDSDGLPTKNTSYKTLATGSNGIPRTVNLNLIKDYDDGTPAMEQHKAISNNGTFDYNLEGALCYWDIFVNENNPLHARLMTGLSEVKASGNLQGIPTIIVHGQSDALIAPNHSSRAYLGLNKQVEGERSNLKYYEIANAQHLDSITSLYHLYTTDMSYVPIDYYFKKAADLMLKHLKEGSALPASQLVKAKAPTFVNSVAVLAKSDLMAIQASPDNPISFNGVDVVIPE